MMDKPYKDYMINDTEWIRTFYVDKDSKEYLWHRDYHDRIVEVLEGNNWKFQFDNQIPKTINNGSYIFIGSMIYHRIIKGSDNLIIRIKEIKNEKKRSTTTPRRFHGFL